MGERSPAALPAARRPRTALLLAISLAVTSAVALAAAGSASAVRAQELQRVTVIGDSVAAAIAYDDAAKLILAQGVDLDLELAPCRRVDQPSCPYLGSRPPNLIELVQSLGSSIGSTAVVAVGYNDFESTYPDNIEHAVQVLDAAGVKRVLWLTLRAASHQYLSMNDAIVAASQRHPELSVVDWNVYSRSHPEWFQDDGLHLEAAGSEAMATLIHNALVSFGIAQVPAATTAATTTTAPAPAPSRRPPRPRPERIVTTALPPARPGRRYLVSLRAQGGRPPYRWSKVGALPAGLQVLVEGRLVGIPKYELGVFPVTVRVTDAAGKTVARRLRLSIRA